MIPDSLSVSCGTSAVSAVGQFFSPDDRVVIERYPKRCVIYAVMPRTLKDLERFEMLGHELLHCSIGKYHD